MTTLHDEDFNGSRIKVIRIDAIDIPVYQRERVKGWAESIAQDWNHHLFTYPRVCVTESGRYECIDGQHTVLAAEIRGHVSLPCAVLTDVDTKTGAIVFSDVNTKRQRPQAYDIFKADLWAERGWAVTLRSITDKHGLAVSPIRGSSNLRAIAQARVIIERGMAADLDDALSILTRVYDPALAENSNRLERKLLMGVVDLVHRSKREGIFNLETVVRKLSKATYSRRGVRGIHLTPMALETDYLASLIEQGTLDMPQLTTGSGSSSVYGKALSIAVYGVEQTRKLYS
jgi:hypothetical protein